MIEFIKPFFNSGEASVFVEKALPEHLDVEDIEESIIRMIPSVGHIVFTDKGEEAISAAISIVKESRQLESPLIAIPSAACGSVYRPSKEHGKVILMDADSTWNCVPDEFSRDADILLFASLGGKRMLVPNKERKDQVLIDDAAQCYDGICGFRRKTDFSIFSFGAGKQMFAGGGGILFSKTYDVAKIKDYVGKNLEPWQKFLMLSQLRKIDDINNRRTKNGLLLIEELKGLEWLSLPDPKNNVFSKFVVFIDQCKVPFFKPMRTDEIVRFMRHMYQHGVQVEETYIPLHIRFPDEFKYDLKRYESFDVNWRWPEAITLPCRPNLSEQEMVEIINAVKKFEPKSKRTPASYSNEKMRIACINYQPVSLYRDQGWSVERLANYYNPTGVAEKVLVMAYQEPEAFNLSESVKVEGFEFKEDLQEKIDEFAPNVIRCYEANYPFSLIALEIANKINKPSYLSLHDSRKHYVPQLSGYTVITGYSETVALVAKSVLKRPVEVQFNGIDSNLFDPEDVLPIDVEDTFQRINVPYKNYDFIVYTVARGGDPLHNMHNLIEALDIFKESSSSNLCFIISGPGFNYFEREWVYPIGKTHETDIRNILSVSDCFLQVRTMPEICMAQTEAMMMGVPLIAAGSTETDSVIKWPVGTTIYDVNNFKMIADHLSFLYANFDRAMEARKKRRKVAVDRFDMKMLRQREADRYSMLFEKFLKSNS